MDATVQKDREMAESSYPTATSRQPKSGYTSVTASIMLVLFPFVTGVIYVLLQWFENSLIVDAMFVSMLIGATIILVHGIRLLFTYLVNKGLNFYYFVLSTEDPKRAFGEYEKMVGAIMHPGRMTLVGILYGFAVGSAPFMLGVWANQETLLIMLSVFMVCVNFVTGVAFYGLVMFFVYAIRMGRMVQVDLWKINNPSTEFLFGATRRIAILASIYIAISLSSILFSVLPLGGLIIGYCIFSAIIILSALIIPVYPVANKLRQSKYDTLLELDNQLHTLFYSTLKDMKDDYSKVDLTKLESLLELRERVDDFSAWPYRLKSVTAGITILFISFVPVLLQLFLERVL